MAEINVYDGKYTVVLDPSGVIIEIKRHGERWVAGDTFIHAGFVLAIVQELIELRETSENYSDLCLDVYGKWEG